MDWDKGRNSSNIDSLSQFEGCLLYTSDDYVPKDSKVRMVDRIVRSMDSNPLMATYDGIGAPPYSPQMLLSLVVFAYINGVYS